MPWFSIGFTLGVFYVLWILVNMWCHVHTFIISPRRCFSRLPLWFLCSPSPPCVWSMDGFYCISIFDVSRLKSLDETVLGVSVGSFSLNSVPLSFLWESCVFLANLFLLLNNSHCIDILEFILDPGPSAEHPGCFCHHQVLVVLKGASKTLMCSFLCSCKCLAHLSEAPGQWLA